MSPFQGCGLFLRYPTQGVALGYHILPLRGVRDPLSDARHSQKPRNVLLYIVRIEFEQFVVVFFFQLAYLSCQLFVLFDCA